MPLKRGSGMHIEQKRRQGQALVKACAHMTLVNIRNTLTQATGMCLDLHGLGGPARLACLFETVALAADVSHAPLTEGLRRKRPS